MAPKTKEQFAEERKRSRENIMAAALNLFANNGYQNTSINQIAKKADVSKGLIYNYFTSKEELLIELVVEGLKIMEGLFSALDTKESPFEQLKHLLTLTFEMMKQEMNYWQLYSSLITQTGHIQKLQDVLKPVYFEMLNILTHYFEEMGYSHPELEARKIAALIDGISLHYLFADENYPIDEIVNYILSQYSKDFKQKKS